MDVWEIAAAAGGSFTAAWAGWRGVKASLEKLTTSVGELKGDVRELGRRVGNVEGTNNTQNAHLQEHCGELGHITRVVNRIAAAINVEVTDRSQRSPIVAEEDKDDGKERS